MKPLNNSTGMDIAHRYLWFITYGVYTTVLNDPKIIKGEATPDYIDHLMQKCMAIWPQGMTEDDDDDHDEPRLA